MAPEVLPVILKGLSDMETLALTIYGEARGEPVEAQIAVGCVCRNRLTLSSSISTYKDVCLEPKQFSCWNSFDPNYAILCNLAEKMISTDGLVPGEILKQCLYISVGIINNAILDNTHGSKNYMTTTLYASRIIQWANGMKPSAVYGKQTFLV